MALRLAGSVGPASLAQANVGQGLLAGTGVAPDDFGGDGYATGYCRRSCRVGDTRASDRNCFR
jgi:hypothetical protein